MPCSSAMSSAMSSACRARGDRYSARPRRTISQSTKTMTSARYDVLGIGNAIVDVIARADENFLLAQGMRKGAMALIDEARAQTIYDAMGPAVEMSGGSAANTVVGVAGFGARAAFIGKLKAARLGP